MRVVNRILRLSGLKWSKHSDLASRLRETERERGKSGIRNDKKRGDRMIKVRAHTHFLVLNQAPFV